MAKRAAKKRTTNNSSGATLWAAADKLRSNMDAAEYKHVVLGLIFLAMSEDGDSEHLLLRRQSGHLAGIYRREAGQR